MSACSSPGSDTLPPIHNAARRAAGVAFCICVAAIGVVTLSFGFAPATDQAARGSSAFQKNCTNGCHMPDLRAGPFAPALVGSAFLPHWLGLGVNELFDRVR